MNIIFYKQPTNYLRDRNRQDEVCNGQR